MNAEESRHASCSDGIARPPSVAKEILATFVVAAFGFIAVALVIPPVPSTDDRSYSFSKVLPLQLIAVVICGVVNRFRSRCTLLDIVIVSGILAIVGFLNERAIKF